VARERDLRFQAEAELTIEREAAAKGREQVMRVTPFPPTFFFNARINHWWFSLIISRVAPDLGGE